MNHKAAVSQAALAFTFSPDEPRDDHGRWTDGGGDGASPATEATRDVARGYRTASGGRDPLGGADAWAGRNDAEVARAFVEAERAQTAALGAGSAEERAVSRFVNTPNGERINAALRSGDISDRTAPEIARMDAAMVKADQATSEPTTLYRSYNGDVGQLHQGDLLTEDGFVSGSALPSAVADRPVSMTMRVPTGTSYLVGDPLSGEVILDRGTTFRVGRMERVADRTQVHVDVVR